jgi:hypothetical protein
MYETKEGEKEMKKCNVSTMLAALLIAGVLFTALTVRAEEFETEIQFQYFGTGDKAAVSYMVRNGGAPVCLLTPGVNDEVTGTPDSYLGKCVTEAFNEGNNNITMLANLADGGLSPASGVYPFYIDYQVSVMRITIVRADGSTSTMSFPITPAVQ